MISLKDKSKKYFLYNKKQQNKKLPYVFPFFATLKIFLQEKLNKNISPELSIKR